MLHHDLMDRQWHGPPKVPLLDDTDFPTRGSWANTDYPSLRNCLRYHHAASSDDEDEVVEELLRTLGREIDIDDDGAGIDQIWLDRHEPTIARGVRKMADMCPRLRYFQWFVDDGVPNLSYTYKIDRYTDGRGRITTGQTSSLDCLKGEVLPPGESYVFPCMDPDFCWDCELLPCTCPENDVRGMPGSLY